MSTLNDRIEVKKSDKCQWRGGEAIVWATPETGPTALSLFADVMASTQITKSRGLDQTLYS